MAFTGTLCRFAVCYDIVFYYKSMYQELKEVNGWNVAVWSIMMKVH